MISIPTLQRHADLGPPPTAHATFGHAAGHEGRRPGRPSIATGLWRTARPHQWIKNGLVVAAPLAAGRLTSPSTIWHVAIAVLALCLAASGTYMLNDAVDAPADRRHPVKCYRPVAVGTITPACAVFAGSVLLAAGVGVAALVGAGLVGVLALYVVLTVSYSTFLKRIAIVDIIAVASGFLLRAIAGAVATSTPVSSPFLLVTSFGALFLVVGKRHGEQLRLGDEASSHRATLAAYTPAFTTQLVSVSVSATLVTYAMWAFGLDVGEGGVPWAAVSVVPFAISVLAATQLVLRGDGANPADLLRNRTVSAAGFVTVALVACAVYLR